MSSAYNLKQKMLNIARADEMLRNPPERLNRKTGIMERYRYELAHIKKITKLNVTDMRGIIKAIIDEQKEKDTNEPKITTLE